MLDIPNPGLYRTTEPMPGHEDEFPKGVLVYLGEKPDGSGKFVVRPGQNRQNRWFWGEPTTLLRSPTWARTLKALPSEGYYTLPSAITLQGGARWLENAIVQLGYDGAGRGIVFVAEQRSDAKDNALYFGDEGVLVDDDMLARLRWAPYLPRTGA